MQRTSRWHGRTPLAALGLAIAVTALPSAGIASVGTQTERPTSAAGASRTAATAATRARGAAKGPLGGTGIVRWGSTYPTASGYERYAYVLIGTNDARAAARLPGMSLVYMSGTSVQTSWSTGVTYDEARAHDWLLKDASGAYVRNEQYGAYVGDIGDVGYQQRFATNVVAVLRASHADGVFIDDVIGDALALTGGAIPSTYPTSDAWESAMVSFVSRVGTLLKARGFYVLVSATKFVSGDLRSNTGEHVTEFWRRLAPSVDGLMAEYWLQSPIDVAQLRTVGTRSVPELGGLAEPGLGCAEGRSGLLRSDLRVGQRLAGDAVRPRLVPARLERKRRGGDLLGHRPRGPLPPCLGEAARCARSGEVRATVRGLATALLTRDRRRQRDERAGHGSCEPGTEDDRRHRCADGLDDPLTTADPFLY